MVSACVNDSCITNHTATSSSKVFFPTPLPTDSHSLCCCLCVCVISAFQEGESMNSHGTMPDNSQDNRERKLSRQSLRSIGKESERSYHSRKLDKRSEDADSSLGDRNHNGDQEPRLERARTRTKELADTDRGRDPDRDRMSDGERSSGSFYSEDYDKLTPSERSISPGSLSVSPRRPARARRVTSSPLHRAGTHIHTLTHLHTH